MKLPVIDLHCDTATVVLGDRGRAEEPLYRRKGHIDLERGKMLDGYAQFFAMFTTPHMGKSRPEDIFRWGTANLLREIEENADIFALARSAEEIKQTVADGKIAAVLSIEGTAGIGYDPEKLEMLRQTGFLMTTLTWNEKNPLAGSHLTGGGLTDLGREFVMEAGRAGILIDVSHLSDEAFWDIMKITEKPVSASHSNSRAVCPVSRNLTDDMFRAICETGGVAGLNEYTEFLGNAATLDTACDHIFHFAELDPDCRHIALGGDWDGCESVPAGVRGIQDYPRLARRLLERGMTEKEVQNIFWNNALGVIGYAVPDNTKYTGCV